MRRATFRLPKKPRLNELPGEPGIHVFAETTRAERARARRDLWSSLTGKSRRPRGATKLPRKEVIQPQVPLRLPCYDFTPITSHTLDGYLLAVELPASSTTGFRDVTGGVYKARERIHHCLLISDY